MNLNLKSTLHIAIIFNLNCCLQIVLIVNDNPTDRQVEESLISLAADSGIQINNTYYLPQYYLTKHKDQLEAILDDSYSKTRSKLISMKF